MNEMNISEVLSLCLSSLAGLFGGLSVSFFWQPKKLHQHGRLTAGVIIGAISVSATFTLAGFVASWLGMNFSNTNNAMGVGYFVGAISVGVIALLANFFYRREDQDIIEVASDIKRYVRGEFENIPVRNRRVRKNKQGEP